MVKQIEHKYKASDGVSNVKLSASVTLSFEDAI